jgi:type IV secretory pathway VirB2 component (pilin)
MRPISRNRRGITFGHPMGAVLLLAVGAAVMMTSPAWAAGGGTAMPWEGPLTTIMNSLAGPVAKAIGVIAIVIAGLGFAFAEGGSAVRKGIGIVFGLAIAFTATTFVTSFFNLTAGAVF